jgi:prepilin-type N-terminal cleavage/methylation domain-containing protein
MRCNFTDRLLSKLRLTHHPVESTKGFTLTELLVVVIIGSIIVTTLLSLVNELLKTSQRESAKSETQRDMQMSLDYIAADLREAAYVYDPTCHSVQTASCPSYAEFIPKSVHDLAGTAGTKSRAVLGFWKVEPLSPEELKDIESSRTYCTDNIPADPANGDALRKECEQVKRQKRSLTLVVYSQQWDDVGTTTKWKGRSRITRYALKKYGKQLEKASGSAKFARNPGYVDPLTDTGLEPIFKTWPFNAAGTFNCQQSPGGTATTGCAIKNPPPTGRAGGSVEVLSDFLDVVRPVSTAANPNPAVRNLPSPICPSNEYSMGPRKDNVPADKFDPSTNDSPKDSAIPNIPAQMASTSFFVCIRGQLDSANQLKQPELGEIQDIVVFLRGNAYGRARFLQDAYLPTLQTTVTLRGIINKIPN